MKAAGRMLGFCVACCFSSTFGQTTEKPQSQKNRFLYNATTSVLNLESNKSMVLIVNALYGESLGAVVGTIQFPDATKASVSGSKTNSTGGTNFTMSISYDGEVVGNGLRASKIAIDIQMFLDKNTLYWTLSAMDITIEGTLTNCTSGCNFTLKNAMVVAPRSGFTSRPVDLNCQRGYSICAPVDLCWTCSDQEIYPKVVNNTGEKMAVSIVMYGMQLQPVSSSKPFREFGYRYDCDPIWSSALWFSLLLSLFMIVVLAWAIDMLVTLNGPSKFDDPKGKPLVVPLTD